MPKDISTLVPDIYALFDRDKEVKVDEWALDAMTHAMYMAVKEALTDKNRDTKGKLRLSQVGKPSRQVWLEYQGTEGEEIDSPTYLKFLFGHMYEALILCLAEQAGHEVRGRQDSIEIEDIRGHRDAVIDNILVDVKSSSTQGMRKFRDGTAKDDNTFGYPLQLSTYLEGSDDCIDREAAWLAVDKQFGTLVLDRVRRDRLPDARANVKRIKEVCESAEMPTLCYLPVPDGKSGNTKLATGCSYCKYKHTCFPDLRQFQYSNGRRYLVNVAKLPKVEEIINA
jgi:hypothetical protein